MTTYTFGTASTQIAEVNAMVAELGKWLLATVPSSNIGRVGSTVRYQVGYLSGNAPRLLSDGSFTSKLLQCFRTATASGAKLQWMDALIGNVLAWTPIGAYGKALQLTCMVFALGEQARLLAATAFSMRSDVEAALAQVRDRFEEAKLTAADMMMDSATYEALLALSAATIDCLATTALPLPRMISIEMPLPLPALRVAYLTYQDASRVDELIDENRVVHPAFLPRVLRAVSA